MEKKMTRVDEFLDKLKKGPTDNDKEILECLMELDDRIQELENRKVL